MIKIKNAGKLFEEDIKKSVPNDCFYYRFRDNASSFSGGEFTRFTSSNICDCFIQSMDKLYLIELKTHTGASIPLSCIRSNQVNGLANINHPRIKAIFIINFRDKEKTYSVDSKVIKEFIDSTDRKSIPINFFEKHGTEIEMIKKKVHYRYNLEKYFKEDK